MRIFYTVISILLLSAFIYIGHYRSLASLPPLVKFFNPYDGWWQQAEGEKLPRRYFEGPVTDEVTIAFDERWVPHIYAETYEDALYAQGILHAYFRLWQMDITNRGTVGRVAEVLGAPALDHDLNQRRVGMHSAALKIANQIEHDGNVKSKVDHYIKGVNTIVTTLHSKDYPLEFKLLDYEPELWTSRHIAAVIMAMTFDLCYKHNDIESTLSYHKIGKKAYTKYFPEWNPKQVPIVQKGKEVGTDSIDMGKIYYPDGQYRVHSMPEEGIGSNNWAIHKSRTKNNKNILANDPHLGLSLPSVWYEMHIHLPEKDIYGVSFPGIPGIVLGFNNHFAWGSTNVSHDVADWYHLIWKDSTFSEYYFDGTWREAGYETEQIAVKDADSVQLSIPITEVGRVPFYKKDTFLAGCAFQWSPEFLYESGSLNTFLGFNLGESYADFKNALPHHKFPAQNFVYADDENIAMHVQGDLPIRKQGEGVFIQDSVQTKQWLSFIPQDKLPFEHNPERGYVSSANQHSTYPSYPFEYHGYFDDYRGRTIDSFLRAYQNIEIEKVEDFQLSTFSLEAKEVLPVLLENIDTSNANEYIPSLKDWNYKFEADEQAPVLFEMWWKETLRLTLDEFIGKAYDHPEAWLILDLIKSNPEDRIFDHMATDEREDASQIIQRALQHMIEQFNAKDQPDWATYKGTVVKHIADIPAFSSDVIRNGGSRNSLNAMQSGKGPSWRMIVELGDEVQAKGVYPGGQSGNPGSRFYDNQISTWAKGEYYPLQLIQEANDKRLIRKWTIQKKQ